MLVIQGNDLALADIVRVARERAPVQVSDDAMARVAAARGFLEKCLAEGRVIYGVNTGIGHLAGVRVEPDKVEDLQRNIVRSHAAGMGPPLSDDEVRAVLLLKLNLFAKGHSGVRPELVRLLAGMIAADVLPVIPAKGSLGASGDLAPLAHVGLCVIGEGEARLGGETMPAGDALKAAGLKPIALSAKEGLGLINGCQVMAGRGTLLLHDGRRLLKTAQMVSAVILDVMGASAAPFSEPVHRVRPYPGQQAVARNLTRLLEGERVTGEQVQDAYSLRCVPQILGGISDAFDDLQRRLDIEVNAASDNPLVFPEEERIIAAGNFHGQSLALALDLFGVALVGIGTLAERQVNRLLNPALSGLPAFLARGDGTSSGLMIMQYTAAALVSETKILAHPASADSIPVSADQEDHVPMGAAAVHKAAEIARNVTDVLGVAALAAVQAMDVREEDLFAPASRAFRERLRAVIPFWDEDRYAAADMRAAAALVREGALADAVEAVTGPLEG